MDLTGWLILVGLFMAGNVVSFFFDFRAFWQCWRGLVKIWQAARDAFVPTFMVFVYGTVAVMLLGALGWLITLVYRAIKSLLG